MSARPTPFHPFADDAAVRTVGAFSVENGTARIALHGALDIPRDRTGLAHARRLKETLDAIVAALEGEDLPDTIAADDEPATRVPNPFA